MATPNLGHEPTYRPRGYHTKIKICGRCGAEFLEVDLHDQDDLKVCERCIDRHVLAAHPREGDKYSFDDMPGVVFP